MFTGIIETLGTVENIKRVGSNLELHISSSISSELKVDQSVSHNGVCLTIINLTPNPSPVGEGGKNSIHVVTAVDETLSKTNLGKLKAGDSVNLERCMKADGRFDGHIVQGHVDGTAICKSTIDKNGSWEFQFVYDRQFKSLLVAKGSICINGVSLTSLTPGPSPKGEGSKKLLSKDGEEFSVAIIPYTFENTNFKSLKEGDEVNLEFDVIGKYVAKMMMQ